MQAQLISSYNSDNYLGLALEPFNHREKRTLYLAAMDKTVLQTAEIMKVSPDAVREYRKRILQKTGCRSITGAVGRLSWCQMVSS